MPDVPTFRAGEPASASKLNGLVDAVREMLFGVRGGKGITVERVQNSLMIGLINPDTEEIKAGVVESVEPADSSGDPVAGYPDDVKYKIRVSGLDGAEVGGEESIGLLNHDDFVEVLNRPAYGTGKEKIVGQPVGTSVWVWMRRGTSVTGQKEPVLIVLKEKAFTKICGQ
jgi:hypothetical protein